MKILLVFDENFQIEKEKICDFLNKNIQYLHFTVWSGTLKIPNNLITKDSFSAVLNDIGKSIDNIKEYDDIYCFTDVPYHNNYFFSHIYTTPSIAIISFWQWGELTNLPKSNGIIYFIADILALMLDESDFRHQETTGCIYDFLWNKTGIDDGMREGRICPLCLERIIGNISSDDQQELLSDLKILLNLLSSASKWNNDILSDESIPSKQETALCKKRAPSTEKGILVMLASPGDTVIERKYILSHLESKFRVNGHEKRCGKRIMVNGWEDLPSQPGYPQDVINRELAEKSDIIVTLFKHKLGTPTIDLTTGKERAASGTVEELMLALNNYDNNSPLGMAYFYQKTPKIDASAKNRDELLKHWDDREAFREYISTRMIYKPYLKKEELLNDLLLDLERVIVSCFE